MKLFKHTLNIILIAFVAIALPFVALTLFTAKSPALAGLRSFVILTGSMSPTIPVGGLVYTQTASTYHVGDIIAFQRQDIVVTHRIASIVRNGSSVSYQTKGDANKAADVNLVASGAVLGRERLMIPYVGSLILFLRTIPGFIGIVVVPTLILIGFEILSIKKEMEKEIEKKLQAKMAKTT